MLEGTASTACGLAVHSLGDRRLESVSCAVLAGNSEVSCRFPFVEAPEWWKLAVPKQGLHQVRHGSDLVKLRLMDSILIAIIMDDKWKNSLWWGGNTGAHAVTLKARIAWDCHIAGPVVSLRR